MYQERDALRMVKFSSAEKALKGKSQVDFRSAYDSAQPAGRKHCFETNLAILHIYWVSQKHLSTKIATFNQQWNKRAFC